MQDNIIHEISIGVFEDKLGLDHIHKLTNYIQDKLWDKAMLQFNNKYHLH
ncbi:hypothetical protein ES703_16544 [subsurface metagenome]